MKSSSSSSVKSTWLCGRKTRSSCLSEDVVESISDKANQYLQSLVDNKTFSGSVLLARQNQIILLKGYGCSEYVCDEKNNSETIYRIGSVTKPFTAILILRLLERKQLKLENRLSSYFSDYPEGNRITIKHLLSNTSGIEDYTELESFEEKCSQNLSIDELIDLFKNEPLKFRPGSKYSYSNSNFILLGSIIEKITGKSYESNLREFILEPCSMKNTGYECDDHQPLCCRGRAKRACGYTCSRDENNFQTCRFIDMSTARGAGGIYSTVEDLYRFDRYLYDETILKEKTKKLMFKPVREHYALGWEVNRLKKGRIRQHHSGQIFGFTSCLARFPRDNACIIFLSNFEETSVDDVLETLTDILFGENTT